MRGHTRMYKTDGSVWHLCHVVPFRDADVRQAMACRTEIVQGFDRYKDEFDEHYDCAVYVNRDAEMLGFRRNNRVMQDWEGTSRRVILGLALMVYGDDEFMRALAASR